MPKEKDTKRMSDIELPWHNEIFHTIPRSHFAQIWAPLLHPATEMIGTLVVCPGSHKSGLKKQVFHKEDLFFYRYTIDPAEIAKYQPTSVSMELGQALIFHHALYHRSGTNLSKQTRISITGSYHDIGSPAFKPLAVEYRYYGETPEAYYYELFHDPDAKELINEQALRHE
ncbi:MAG: phytanoyl-CoA dioxygenase family protein [Coxiellaceae bacterium]|nr:MAG: phytanoyl-CoA dioxygenase family protein [Coxiellaceae bacterium]